MVRAITTSHAKSSLIELTCHADANNFEVYTACGLGHAQVYSVHKGNACSLKPTALIVYRLCELELL